MLGSQNSRDRNTQSMKASMNEHGLVPFAYWLNFLAEQAKVLRNCILVDDWVDIMSLLVRHDSRGLRQPKSDTLRRLRNDFLDPTEYS